jgi:hypothetical protein
VTALPAAQGVKMVAGADSAHTTLLESLEFDMTLWALLEETERMHDQAADESEILGLTAQPAASSQIPMQPRQVTPLTCSM